MAEQSGRLAPAPAKPAPAKPVSAPAGKAAIYVGFGKDELELRKSGAQGRVIVDDPALYPGKEDLGFFNGATGGFAGGEKGVRMLVDKGELKLRPPGDLSRKRQVSSLALGAFVVAAAAGGGIILTDAIDLGEEARARARALPAARQRAAGRGSPRAGALPPTRRDRSGSSGSSRPTARSARPAHPWRSPLHC